eukprot:TRINITY_DN3528_c0_g1_i17.p1 TRINITY_DN3528_c0_g1~~TRINITY_DN3528_c0_g1_i17.p1  ORF type:complete len:317 (-),score=81.80 TRINITY_DN3528_c0_g1_i17:16-966(-)
MAPEILSRKGYSCMVDMYSFALVLFSMVTGKTAYQAIPILSFVNAITNKGFREEIPNSVNPVLQLVISTCWHQIPEKRLMACQVQLILWNLEDPRNNFVCQTYTKLLKNTTSYNHLLSFMDHKSQLAFKMTCKLPFYDAKKLQHVSGTINPEKSPKVPYHYRQLSLPQPEKEFYDLKCSRSPSQKRQRHQLQQQPQSPYQVPHQAPPPPSPPPPPAPHLQTLQEPSSPFPRPRSKSMEQQATTKWKKLRRIVHSSTNNSDRLSTMEGTNSGTISPPNTTLNTTSSLIPDLVNTTNPKKKKKKKKKKYSALIPLLPC